MKRMVVCEECGSREGIQANASAEWNEEKQCWEVSKIWEKGGICTVCKTYDARWSFMEIKNAE